MAIAGGRIRTVMLALRVVVTVAGRPRLWRTAFRQWRRLTPRGWWRTAPFLPVPSRDYLHFRLVTQYGGDAHPGNGDRRNVHDVVHYLSWCHQWETCRP